MPRVDLNAQERLVFGAFLKQIGELLYNKKIHDTRSSVSVERSTHEGTRVRIEASFYVNDAVQAALTKLAADYKELT